MLGRLVKFQHLQDATASAGVQGSYSAAGRCLLPLSTTTRITSTAEFQESTGRCIRRAGQRAVAVSSGTTLRALAYTPQ
jgi:hypothetical protein